MYRDIGVSISIIGIGVWILGSFGFGHETLHSSQMILLAGILLILLDMSSQQ